MTLENPTKEEVLELLTSNMDYEHFDQDKETIEQIQDGLISAHKKFKIGQKVKIIRDFNEGKIGEIEEIFPDMGDGVPLQIKIDNCTTLYNEFDIRVIKRKRQQTIKCFKVSINDTVLSEIKEKLEIDADEILTEADVIKELFCFSYGRGDTMDFREKVDVKHYGTKYEE